MGCTSSHTSSSSVESWDNPKVLPSTKKVNAVVIVLHGLGDTPGGITPWALQIQNQLPNTVKVIVPAAPSRLVTLTRARQTAWFNIKGKSINDSEDNVGIDKAVRYVHSLAEAEVKKGVSPDRIYFLGFSQGGALALRAGLMFKGCGGVVVCSGYLPGVTTLKCKCPKKRVLFCHGNQDTIVPFTIGRLSADIVKGVLNEDGVAFKKYNCGHSIIRPMTTDIVRFLRAGLGDGGARRASITSSVG